MLTCWEVNSTPPAGSSVLNCKEVSFIHKMLRIRRAKLLKIVLAALIAIFVIITMTLLGITMSFQEIFLKILYQNLVYAPGSKFFEVWNASDVSKVKFMAYVYNLTNSQEVLNGGRLNFEEIGPFVYDEHITRINTHLSEENPPKRIRFSHRHVFVFSRASSVGSTYETKIIAPNMQYMHFGGTGQHPFVTYTVDELLWNNRYTVLGFNVANFGLFASRNNSITKPITLDTGVENIRNVGKVLELNGKRRHNLFKQDEADMVGGFQAERLSPGLEVGTSVKLLISSVCRSVRAYAVNKTSSVHRSDVELVVFSGMLPGTSDPSTNWEERIYCNPKEACPPKGLVSFKKCLQKDGGNLDLYASLPRFLNADARIVKNMDGIPEPNEKEHGSYIHVEPLTGLTLEGLERIQLNILMANKNKDYQSMKGPYYMPIVWYIRENIADKATMDAFKTQILDARTNTAFAIQLACGLFGMMSVFWAVILAVLCLRTRKQAEEEEQLTSVVKCTTFSLGNYESGTPDVESVETSSILSDET
ncbi:hypothetical protein EG68_02628 [Paragonimus skrjabini miyazakii]|uniref:Uncharacterized protein n=1 Tax=Paragonimus skrjabini miyazakii TaxID=59628 RepID=A0A8S9YYR4_9TREM|nr:hypothetical protein EG68_02628 [Paragonimus skrjabini miyazakii]